MVIEPGRSRLKIKAEGLIVNKGGTLGSEALNIPCPSNSMALAVVARKEPPKSREAWGPKRMPLGLSKNRLALPKTPNFPRIDEGLLPVTRLIILLIPSGLLK